jgi:hypothetical protein
VFGVLEKGTGQELVSPLLIDRRVGHSVVAQRKLYLRLKCVVIGVAVFSIKES